VTEKRCPYCGKEFIADPRVGVRQKACSPACQKLRKKENNRLYRENNPECWENHYEQYGKPWRQRHPDYQRQWRQRRKRAVKGRSSGEIKAERLRKAIEWTEKTCLFLREIQAEIPLQVLPTAAKKASFLLQALR
jgi:hypothetical protein